MLKINKHFYLEIISNIMISLIIIQNLSEKMGVLVSKVNAVLGLILLFLCVIEFHFSKTIFKIYILALLISLINFIFVKEMTFGAIPKIFIIYFSLSYYFAKEKIFSQKLWTFVLCLLMLYISYLAIKKSLNGDLNIFYNASRNYVSLYLLTLMLLLAIVYHTTQRQLPVVFLYLYFILCIISVGRAGIISGLILVVGDMYNRFFNNGKFQKYNMRFLIGIIILIIGFCIIGINKDFIVNKYFFRFVDKNSSGSNYLRLHFLIDYLSSCNNIWSILFGSNSRNLSKSLIEANGNLHNSYLMLHSYVGLFGVFIGIKSLLKVIYIFLKNDNVQLGLLILAFMVRILFDYFLPSQMGDIILWYCIIIVHDKNSILIS